MLSLNSCHKWIHRKILINPLVSFILLNLASYKVLSKFHISFSLKTIYMTQHTYYNHLSAFKFENTMADFPKLHWIFKPKKYLLELWLKNIGLFPIFKALRITVCHPAGFEDGSRFPESLFSCLKKYKREQIINWPPFLHF